MAPGSIVPLPSTSAGTIAGAILGNLRPGLRLPNLASGASVPKYPNAPSRPPSASRATGRTGRRANPVSRISTGTDRRRLEYLRASLLLSTQPPSDVLALKLGYRTKANQTHAVPSHAVLPPSLTGRTKSATLSPCPGSQEGGRSKQSGSGSAAWLKETREDRKGSGTTSLLPGAHHVPDSRETGWPPRVPQSLPPLPARISPDAEAQSRTPGIRSPWLPLRCISSNQPLDPFLLSLTRH